MNATNSPTATIAIQTVVETAAENSDRSAKHFDRILAVLVSADGGPFGVDDVMPLIDASETTARQVLNDLYTVGVVQRDDDGQGYAYALDEKFLQRRIEVYQVDGGNRA